MSDRVPDTVGKIGLRDIRLLREHNTADAQTTHEAITIKENALLMLSMQSSPLTNYLDTRINYHIPTTAIPTMAVSAGGDGTMMLLFNPEFTVKLGQEGAIFVLYHEMAHLLFRHFSYVPELRNDPVFTQANEIVINHFVAKRLSHHEDENGVVHTRDVALPRIATGEVDAKGRPVTEETGVNPKTSYQKYSRDLKGQGLEPVDYERFVSSDITCYSELKRMKNPPGSGKTKIVACIHQAGDDDDGTGDGIGVDQETIDRAAGDAVSSVLAQAIKGLSKSKREILDLAAATENGSERSSQMWGTLGVGAIRGETVKTRKVEWWQRWLWKVLGSRLTEGGRMIWPRKRGVILHELGFDSPLMHRGPERQKNIVIAVDASGSMSDEIIDKISKLVGQISKAKVHWLWFDATVAPFVPGEPIRGGGGTSFQVVADYVEGRLTVDELPPFNEKVDAVLMVTDGYAPPIRPAEPKKWIWLITPGGNTWPQHATENNPAMTCSEIDIPD